jgi:hypothetical protein
MGGSGGKGCKRRCIYIVVVSVGVVNINENLMTKFFLLLQLSLFLPPPPTPNPNPQSQPQAPNPNPFGLKQNTSTPRPTSPHSRPYLVFRHACADDREATHGALDVFDRGALFALDGQVLGEHRDLDHLRYRVDEDEVERGGWRGWVGGCE